MLPAAETSVPYGAVGGSIKSGAGGAGSNQGFRGFWGVPMATYRMVYGDDDQAVTEIYDNIDTVEREDGWLVLFRGRDAILRVQESHVQSFERLVA